MQKIKLFLVLVLITNLSFGQERSISGNVTGAGSQAGLSGAHLALYLLNTDKLVYQGISGHNGEFEIHHLPSEKLSFTVSYLGFRFYTSEIDLGSKDPGNLEVILEPSPVEVGEVMVSAIRQDRMLRNVALPLAVVNENSISRQPAITPANLFADIPGVNMARDGIWATSMNIRGLTEQRIVSLVDGNRVETATDIAGGLAMIDVNDIERIEVIKGAASSLYGTGALGGVVNIITREGHYHDKFYAGGSLGGMYQSVNNMNSENASLELADQKWYARISGTYRDAGNTMTPKGELANSQFTDNNISIKLGVKPIKNHEFTLNYQKFDAQDVGIPGGSAFPATATAIYPEEKRNMLSATYAINLKDGPLNRIKFKYFYQYILRDVQLKPSAAVTLTPTGNHTTNGFQAQTDWSFGTNNQLTAGIDIWQRSLSTSREKKIVSPVTDSTGTVIGSKITIRGEVPIPDAWFTSAGAFAQDQFSVLNNKLNLSFGGRFDFINTRNDLAVDPLYLIVNGTRNNNPPNQRITFEEGNTNNYSWSLDAGAIYHLSASKDLTLNISRAFRAPSIEERFKYIDLGSTVRIGDPNLKPEQGYFFDLGTRMWMDKLQLTADVFANSMTNLIVESPGVFIYNYSANPANFDTLNALINSNVDKAILYGFDLSTGYNVFDGFTIKASAGFVRGKNTTTNSSLPQVPPFSGRLIAKYSLNGLFSTELSANLYADQDKIASGEKTSKGYSSYDFGIYSDPLKIFNFRLEVFGGVQNITDRAYMNHLATNRGFIKYEPGRNFYLKLRFSF